MLLNKEQVMAFLPHRDPFLFVDSVDSIDVPVSGTKNREELKNLQSKDIVGGKVICSFFTRENLAIFAGHFPGKPILPGVVQVEMMAQSASFMIVKYLEKAENLDMDVALMSVSNAKFRRPIIPNMQLKIEAVCTKCRGPIMEYDCKIFNEDNLMSEATVMASIKIN